MHGYTKKQKHILDRALALLIALLGLAAAPPSRAADASNGAYGGYVGSDQWFHEQQQSATNRAALQSLGNNAANRGGCASLPRGWAAVAARIRFPAAYGGYPEWVNVANLVPAGTDLKAFLDRRIADTPYTQPAIGQGADTVTTRLCAPGRRVYWLVVDSGMARVAIARVRLPGAGHTAQVALTAPPLSPAAPAQAPAPAPQAAPAPAPTPPPHADQFDLGGFPAQPTNFEEQLVMAAIQSATTPALKQEAHARLARYYEEKGDTARAREEQAKAAYWGAVTP